MSINTSTYLNAYWLAWVEYMRLEALANLANFWTLAVATTNDTSGTAACPGGGQATLTVTGTAPNRTRALSGTNCNIGAMTFNGTISSANATFSGTGVTAFATGRFNFSGLSYRLAVDSNAVVETLDDTSTFTASVAQGLAGYQGTVKVTRNGKTDSMANVAVSATTAFNAAGGITLSSGSADLTSPRFASALAIGGDLNSVVNGGPTIVASAVPDRSNITGTEQLPLTTPRVRKYVLRNETSGNPVYTNTLPDNDAAVQAAIANATN